MELLARFSTGANSPLGVSATVIQGFGLAATVVFWGVGFGWVSRRFEWQADLFGARCVTPAEADCHRPCSVHPDSKTTHNEQGRVCVTAATVFASALNRVAILNGIPKEPKRYALTQHTLVLLLSSL